MKLGQPEIRDKNGFLINEDMKIRDCASNIAKMCWFKYFRTFGLGHMKYSMCSTIGEIPRILKEAFLVFIMFPIMFILSPFLIPFMCNKSIKKAKKQYAEWERTKNAK